MDSQHGHRWTRELAGDPPQMFTLLALSICDGWVSGDAISASKQYQRCGETGKMQPIWFIQSEV